MAAAAGTDYLVDFADTGVTLAIPPGMSYQF